jgi:hypothetical protein
MKPFALLPIILCACLLVAPVWAGIEVTGGNIDIAQTIRDTPEHAYIYNVIPSERIAIVEFDIPINTRVDFTLTYGTGSTVTGYMIYEPVTIAGISSSTVSLGGNTRSENFIDAQALGYALIKHVQFQSYAVNKSASPAQPGFALYAQGYGLFSQEIVFYPVNNITSNLITGISITSTQPFDLTIITNDADRLASFVTKSVAEYQANVIGDVSDTAREWINIALSVLSFIKDVTLALFYWLKFFFVDNLMMTIALYLTITMAFAARASKGNMAKFLRIWFKDQQGLFRFIVEMWRSLVGLISTVRGIFRL